MADSLKRCSAHEDLIREVTRIATNTDLIMLSVNRIEARVYDEHGVVAKADGKMSATLRVVGVAAAVATAISAAVAIAISVVAG